MRGRWIVLLVAALVLLAVSATYALSTSGWMMGGPMTGSGSTTGMMEMLGMDAQAMRSMHGSMPPDMLRAHEAMPAEMRAWCDSMAAAGGPSEARHGSHHRDGAWSMPGR